MNRLIDFKSRFRILKGGKISLVVSAFLGGAIIVSAAPSGGVVTSGNASISQNANVTNITQTSNKASINWNDFSIKANETVNFNQPNVNSITLNRVVGNERSIIDGALNANGQVWILNSNGVLFGKNAKVNTAGILATTANLSDADFQNGNYNFKSDSNESVVNLGTIEVSNNGYVVLASNEVRNEGTIKAIRGKVHLTSAKEYTVNLNGNSIVNLIVNKGTLDAMVENKGSIIANGGEIYLTTNAVNELLKGVVNNTGIIEANSLDGLMGKVELFAHGGTAEVGGTITAKDGFVETSGRDFNIAKDTTIKARKWLIDPTNITVDDATAYNTALNNGTETTIQTDNASGSDDGNIYINDSIIWDKAAKLTLNAWNDIFINKEITASNANGKLELLYGQKAANANNTSGYHINAKVNLHAGNNFITKLGSNGTSTTWTVVTDATAMQAMTLNDATKNYALGTDLTLSGTNNWAPIGSDYINTFKGKFDGLNHKVSNLNISTAGDYVGFFGYTNTGSIIQNIHLENAYISSDNNHQIGLLVGLSESTIKNAHTSGEIIGLSSVGGLVGLNNGVTIKSSSSSAKVTGSENIGGLVGLNSGTIEKSYATGSVIGTYGVGGLVGRNDENINNSYATGSVNGTDGVGGLAGRNYETSSKITNSYSIGKVTGTSNVGGLVGIKSYSSEEMMEEATEGTIENSFYDNTVNTSGMNDSATLGKTKAQISTALSNVEGWSTTAGGNTVAGYELALLPYLTSVTRDEDKSFTTLFEGGMGIVGNPYTITNWTQLQNINNSNILTQNYYFNLLNNLSNLTSDYDVQASSTANSSFGWNPIGSMENPYKGTFDGLGFTISDLYINRPTQYYVGLFSYTNNATIKNIGLKDVDIKGEYYVGSLVGETISGRIENSYATGTVSGTSHVGGLVGHNTSGTIQNSYASGTVSATSRVGGLVGVNATSGVIENSYASGTVSGGSDVGGLVGYNHSATITNSVYDNETNTSASMSDSSHGRTTAQMQDIATFSDATWSIVEDSTVAKGTPFLAWQNSGNSYTTTWVIGTKSGVTPDPVDPVKPDPKPDAQTVDLKNIITPITNQTAITVPTMPQVRAVINNPEPAPAQANTPQGLVQETRVPLVNNPIVQIINAGVNLPEGVDQLFFVTNENR